MIWGQRPGGRTNMRARWPHACLRSTGTPRPRTFRCHGRSPGLRVVAFARLPGIAPSDTNGRRLAADSCGGSAGLQPASLLALDLASRETMTTRYWGGAVKGVNMWAALSPHFTGKVSPHGCLLWAGDDTITLAVPRPATDDRIRRALRIVLRRRCRACWIEPATPLPAMRRRIHMRIRAIGIRRPLLVRGTAPLGGQAEGKRLPLPGLLAA